MKLYPLLSILLLAIGALSACKEKEPCARQQGDSYVGVTLTIGSSAFRADENDNYNKVGTWNGKDDIKTMDVFVLDNKTVTREHYTESDLRVVYESNGTVIIKPKKAIKTKQGMKIFYALVNAYPSLISELIAYTPKEFIEKWATQAHNMPIAEAASYNATHGKDVVMAACIEPAHLNEQPDITEEQALDENKNSVPMTMKRAVARVFVTAVKENFEVAINGKKIGVVSNLTYSGAQGDKSLYLGQKKVNGLIQSPGYAWMPTSASDFATAAADKYDYSDLQKKDRKVIFHPKGTLTNPESEITQEWLKNSFFIAETTHSYQNNASNLDPAKYDGGYRRGNTAYVLIRATFTPTSFADNGSYTPGSTFYYGANNKFYTNEANVHDPKKGGVVGQNYQTYKDGVAYYYSYLNPDNKETPLEAPVFRNSVYHLNISSVNNIGLNWNPLYPENPSQPNPDPSPDGDRPTPLPFRPEDPLSPVATWITVQITVIPWNVNEYEEVLGHN